MFRHDDEIMPARLGSSQESKLDRMVCRLSHVIWIKKHSRVMSLIQKVVFCQILFNCKRNILLNSNATLSAQLIRSKVPTRIKALRFAGWKTKLEHNTVQFKKVERWGQFATDWKVKQFKKVKRQFTTESWERTTQWLVPPCLFASNPLSTDLEQ